MQSNWAQYFCLHLKAFGRLEFALIQDLRRSKRLLPLVKTVDVDADPYLAKLRSPGSAEERFALVQSRLGDTMFDDSFESHAGCFLQQYQPQQLEVLA